MDKLKRLLTRIFISDTDDGEDEQDVLGYRPLGRPAPQVDGTLREVDQVIIDTWLRRETEEDEVIGDENSVLGVRGQRRNHSSWMFGKDRKR